MSNKVPYVKIWKEFGNNKISIKEIVDKEVKLRYDKYSGYFFVDRMLDKKLKLNYLRTFKDILTNSDVYMYEAASDADYWNARKIIREDKSIKTYFNGMSVVDLYTIINYFNEDFIPDMKSMKIINIDIEVESDKNFFKNLNEGKFIYPITLAAINDINTDKSKVLGYKECSNSYYKKLEDERALIEILLKIISGVDVITGWNVRSFDIPYIVNRAMALNIKLPFKCKPTTYKDGSHSVKIDHCSTMDYLLLYKKFAGKQLENFKLNTVAAEELKIKKIEYEEGNINDFYINNFEKFVEYNLRDVELVNALDKKFKLIEFGMSFSYMTKVDFEECMSTISPWEHVIACEVFKNSYNSLDKKIIPYYPDTVPEKHEFEGGWTYLKHKNLLANTSLVFDIVSSYPNQIIAYNVSKDCEVEFEDLPEDLKAIVSNYKTDITKGINNFNKIIDDDIDNYEKTLSNLKYIEDNLTPLLQKYNYTMTPTGLIFKRDKVGFIPEIIKNKLNRRVFYKKEYKRLNNMLVLDKDNKELESQARAADLSNVTLKVLLNGYYGANGNRYFKYYNIHYALGITKSAQLSIRGVIAHLLHKKYGYFNTDTDSVFIDVDNLIDHSKPILEEVKRVAAEINKEIDYMHDYLTKIFNHTERRIYMENEAVLDRGAFVAKKNYAFKYLIKDGQPYDGFKHTKNFTAASKFIRNNLKNYLKIMFDRSLTIERWKEEEEKKIKESFVSSDLELISTDKNLNECGSLIEVKDNILSKLKVKSDIKPLVMPKGSIIHRRASLIYNYIIEEKNLKLDKIESGDKVKMLFVKMPNKYNTNVIATNLQKFPKEVLEEFEIDYEEQYDKTVGSTLDRILTALHIKNTNIDEEVEESEEDSSEI